MTLGEQIKQAREEKNYSQEELASKLDVSRQAISKWENDTSVPKGINREMLNQVLEMSLEIEDDNNCKLIDKYKKIMVIGWILAIIFAVSTIVLSIILYKVTTDNETVTYSQEEAITELGVPGTDSDSEAVYVYIDKGTATEQEVNTSKFSPTEE